MRYYVISEATLRGLAVGLGPTLIDACETAKNMGRRDNEDYLVVVPIHRECAPDRPVVQEPSEVELPF